MFIKKQLEAKVFSILCRALARSLPYLSLLLFSLPKNAFSQKLQISFSYFNLTRNSGGGTTEPGDTLEIHALAKVNSNTRSFYFLDTIPTGFQYISNSLELMTNEGVLFSGSGPYSDASNDDNGVYDATIPGVRVNIGTGASNAKSGASFTSTSGGGTVTAGSVPKFYGSTLFVVAFKLVVTGSYGDTLYPTGNFYFDTTTSGSHPSSYHFTYPGIKIIQNQSLCNNYLGASFSAESSFGSGSTTNRSTGATVPGYTKINIGLNAPGDNYYSIVNNTSADGTTNNSGAYKPTTNNHRVFGGFWDIIGDHTGATNTALGNPAVTPGQTGGYMLVVNAAFTTGEAYRDTIKNVCPNTYYEFSAWIRNMCGYCGIDQNGSATYKPGVLPNLSFAINDIDYYTSGNIQYDSIWEKHGFIYKTGPTETQFRITIKNNAAGGGGNDWVLDDINLATCYPNLTNSPKDTATSCTGIAMSLSDTVRSYFNNYDNYCWQKSTDGVNWISTGVCSTATPVLVNGEYQYVVDTTFTPVAADSGTFYRLSVATTSANLSNSVCTVSNSQKIFVKIYNVSCILLNTKVLNFNGSMDADKATLFWTTQNETNLKSYVVERSTDGTHFLPIGTVNPSGSPNTSPYTYTDPDPVASYAYYRLKLISNLDSKISYSTIISLYNAQASLRVSAVNPFTSNLNLNLFLPSGGRVLFNLYDIYGKLIKRDAAQFSQGTSRYTITGMEDLPAGIYILRSFFDNSVTQSKLFKLN